MIGLGMKKLWDREYEASVFGRELADQARALDRPVLQDIVNVLCIVVNCNGDWMKSLRTVIPQVLNTGPAHSAAIVTVDSNEDNTIESVFRNYALYAVDLVSEVRSWLKEGLLEFPEKITASGCTLEDIKDHYNADDFDDLARCIARSINYVTAGVDHPWSATSIISRSTLKLTQALKWWTDD